MSEISTTTLSNGLPVVFIPSDSETYNLFFLAGVGFRFEDGQQMGISRFLANSLFYGASSLPNQNALYEKMDDLGISARTEVSAEYTFFNFNILPNLLDESLKLFAEILTKPLFNEANVSEEAKITASEISRGQLNIQQRAFDRVNQLIFGNHPLGFYSMGTQETIKNINREKLLNFYQKHYVSRNCLLVILGPSATQQSLGQTFGQLASGEKQNFTPFDFGKIEPKSESMPLEGNIAQFVLSWFCYPRGAQERTAQALLNAILSYGRANSFLGQLRKDKVVVLVSSLINLYSDCGVFSMLGSAENYRVKQAQDQMLGIVEGFKQQLISEAILERAKNLYRSRLATLMESSLEQSLFHATRTFFGINENSIGEVFAQIDRVTPADIQKVAQTIFYPRGMFSVTAGSGF